MQGVWSTSQDCCYDAFFSLLYLFDQPLISVSWSRVDNVDALFLVEPTNVPSKSEKYTIYFNEVVKTFRCRRSRCMIATFYQRIRFTSIFFYSELSFSLLEISPFRRYLRYGYFHLMAKIHATSASVHLCKNIEIQYSWSEYFSNIKFKVDAFCCWLLRSQMCGIVTPWSCIRWD